MSRPPVKSPDEKLRIALTVVRGEVSISEAARREGVSETSIAKWRDQFLEGARQGLAAGAKTVRDPVRSQLEAECEQLKAALGEAHAELRVLKKGGPGSLTSGSWR
jgi:transposase